MHKCIFEQLGEKSRSRMGVGLEDNLDTPLDGEVVTDEAVIPASEPDVESTVESNLLEVEEASGEMQGIEKELVELEGDQDTLEEVAVSMEAALNGVGLPVSSVPFAKLSVDQIRRRWKLKGEIVPAMEDFEGGRRDYSTRIALEGLKETLKDIWDAIWRKITDLMSSFGNWLAKVFSGTAAMRKRALAVIEKARTGVAKTSQPVSAKSVPEIVKHLGFTGTNEEFVQQLARVDHQNDAILTSAGGTAFDNMVTGIAHLLSSRQSNFSESDESKDFRLIDAYVRRYLTVIGIAHQSSDPTGDSKHANNNNKGMHLYVTEGGFDGEYPGRYGIYAFVPDEKSGRPFSDFRLELSKKQYLVAKRVKGVDVSLDSDHVQQSAKMVVGLMDRIDSYRQEFTKRRDGLKSIGRIVDALLKKNAEKTNDMDKVEEAKSIRRVGSTLTSLYRKFTTFNAQWIGYIMQLARGVLVYCDQSLSKVA